jgi:enoyl-CoA hydratase/carnithine racemase
MSDVLECVLEGRVLRLTLNRPEKRNALNFELCRDLVRAFVSAGSDPHIGAILLCGNGKSFCAGMDLGQLTPGETSEIDSAQEQLFSHWARADRPIVAAIRGSALGGGTGLVVNCHIAVASEDATFGLTEVRLGLWPLLIYHAVTAALGERRTIELALTGRIFSAQEALGMGLIHEIAPDPEARAVEIAQTIAGYSPTAIRDGLAFVEEARGRGWEAAGSIARRVRNEIFETPDFAEGLRAFREKRPPKWPSLHKFGEKSGD